MNDPAVGVKDLLVTAGFVFEDTVFIGRPPLKPEKTVAVVNWTGGKAPWPHLALNFPSVQVMTRGKPNDYVGASQMIRNVVKALLGIPSQTVNGDWWDGITQMGDCFFLGYDSNNCPMFSANFSIIMEPQTNLGNRATL